MPEAHPPPGKPWLLSRAVLFRLSPPRWRLWRGHPEHWAIAAVVLATGINALWLLASLL